MTLPLFANAQALPLAEPFVRRLEGFKGGNTPVAVRSLFVVKPGEATSFMQHAGQLAAFVNGKDSPALFRFFQNAEHPERIVLFEEWKNGTDMGKNRTAAHTRQFMQAVNAQLREPVQLRLYRPASQPMPGEGNVDRTLVEAQPPATPTAAKTGERLAAAGLSGAPFALLVDVPVKPGGAALMKDTAVRVQAATLQEAACIRYGYFQDVETPDAFLLFEWWQHFEGMAAHVELPHFQELMRTFGAIGGQGRTVGIYKPLPF